MNTPAKASKSVLLTDFECTRNATRAGTEEKSGSSCDWDGMTTPKKCHQFSPFKDRLLRKQEFHLLKNNRARLIDWYLEVFGTYNLGWDCFWLTVELVDSLIADFDYVNLGNIHLVGIVCCFITAKFSGQKSLNLRHVAVGLGHNKFS
jgi:hypothetical protein